MTDHTPQVRVGILSSPAIRFTLTGLYTLPDGTLVSGTKEVSLSDSALALNFEGRTYTSVEFTPTSYRGDSFEIEGVTIGVSFHWQRKENQRFRGALRIIVEDGKLTAINILDIEDYLVSVISSEMSATSSLPLLRAHAVISRGWVLSMIQRSGSSDHSPSPAKTLRAITPGRSLITYRDREDHLNFDVCADDHCQRYQGLNRISSYDAAGAVADTRGEVLTFDGQICDTRFSKCCGGVMETFETCWDDDPRPYLRARRDTPVESDFPDLTDEGKAREWIESSPASFCNTSDRRILSQVLNGYDCETPDFYRWTVELPQQKAATLITDRLGEDLGDIIDLRPLVRGASARIRELLVIGSKGRIVVGKELTIRRLLSDTHLYSSAFTVERIFGSDKEIPEKFILRGAGWGHGVGLCQIGAAIMGDRGYSYAEILRHYYPGTTLQTLY